MEKMISENKNERSWYVLHTKSRFENVVNEALTKKSIESFLPKIKVRSKRRDRKIMINLPLFPGYIFVKSGLSPNERLEIVKTVGVVRFIGFNDGPVPVVSDVLESLKIMVGSEDDILTGNIFEAGDKVIVVNGPLTGVAGNFVRYKGKDCVVVNIEALGQFASVVVDKDDVELLPKILT